MEQEERLRLSRRRVPDEPPIMKCRYESRFSHSLNNPEGSINLTKSTWTTLEQKNIMELSAWSPFGSIVLSIGC